MSSWVIDDIPWNRFDPEAVDADLVPVVKAASLVEYNADDYRRYLNQVFRDDPKVCAAVNSWAKEELQHGVALGRWAELADPDFDFERHFERFRSNFSVPQDVDCSVRGSRAGELIARCMVETGTNSFYSILADTTDEPVLKVICQRIADDEYAHYHLFYQAMCRYLRREPLKWHQKIRIAFERIVETEDDELASAYWAANACDEQYDRRANAIRYAGGTLRHCRPRHVDKMVRMILKAMGLSPRGPLGWMMIRAVRAYIFYRWVFVPNLRKFMQQMTSRGRYASLAEE